MNVTGVTVSFACPKDKILKSLKIGKLGIPIIEVLSLKSSFFFSVHALQYIAHGGAHRCKNVRGS